MEKRTSAYSQFSFSDEISVTRSGKTVWIKGRDGTNTSTDSVEANLLFEILKALKRK